MTKELETIDIGSLAAYLSKVKDIPSVTKMNAAMYLRDFIIGQDIAGQMLAKAIQMDIRAKARLEEAESIAYLDRASDYLKSKDIKDSSEAKKMVVAIDKDVIIAKDERAKTEALVVLMKNKLSILRQSHDSLKKVIYNDGPGTPWEGMS